MLGEDVSRFAERPGNRDGTGRTGNRRTGSRYKADFVVTAVKDGAGQFVEARIQEHEMFAGHILDRANLGDEKPGIAHEVSAWFQFEAYPATRDPLGLEPRLVPCCIIFGDIDLWFARPI